MSTRRRSLKAPGMKGPTEVLAEPVKAGPLPDRKPRNVLVERQKTEAAKTDHPPAAVPADSDLDVGNSP